jgi:predicted transposase/invertase (TIGR01784 family)
MRPGIDPKVDYAFKKLFGSETNIDLLSELLHAVLQPPPGREIVELTILNPFNDKDTTEDKLSVLDVKARDASGRRFHVEMQMIAPWYFPQRVAYYWARLYAQQMAESSRYRDLRPAVSVAFVNSVLFREQPGLHHRFRAVDPRTQLELTDHLEIHVVELPKFALPPEQLASGFDRWCYFLRHGETLDSVALPAALDTPGVHRALEVLNVLTQNDIERERYEARLKGQLDEASLRAEIDDARAEAREEGLKEGHKEGHKEGEREGLRKGELIGRIQLFQEAILKQAPTPRAELENLAFDQLAAVFGQLSRQTSPPAS